MFWLRNKKTFFLNTLLSEGLACEIFGTFWNEADNVVFFFHQVYKCKSLTVGMQSGVISSIPARHQTFMEID